MATTTYEVDDHIKVVVTTEVDHDAFDSSYLGEWKRNQPTDHFIDQKYGLMLGELVDMPRFEVKLADIPNPKEWAKVDEDGYPMRWVEQEAGERLLQLVADAELYRYYMDDEDPLYDQENEVFYTDGTHAWELLASDLGENHDRNILRWFKVNDNHLPFHPEDWGLFIPTEEYPTAKAAAIDYCVRDWERACDYGDGWSGMITQAVIYVDNVQVAESNGHGFDSDDDTGRREAASEAISEAITTSHLPNLSLQKVLAAPEYEDE
jgi:hypothetical protein